MVNWLHDGKRMTAERREEALSAYLDGELSQRERADLEGALARDPALRGELEELRQVVGMMQAVPQVPLPRSFTLDPAVYGRPQRSWFQLYPVLRTATVLATVVFVFLFAANLALNFGGMSGVPAEEPQIAAMRSAETAVVEMEKVEVTRQVEAPAPKVAADAATEEAAEEAPAPRAQEVAPTVAPESALEGESVAPGLGTEAATAAQAAPAEPPTAATIPSEPVGEQPPEPTGETAGLMAVPPTAATEGAGESSSVAAPGTATPTAAPSIEAYELEAPQATPEVAPETAEGEVAPRGAKETGEGPDWIRIAEIGLGALVAILLVLTLLARHYNW